MTPRVQSRACPRPGPHWGQPGYPPSLSCLLGEGLEKCNLGEGPHAFAYSVPTADHALPGTLLSTLGPFRLKSHLSCEAERLQERHVVMSPLMGNRAIERGNDASRIMGLERESWDSKPGSAAPPDTSPGSAEDLPQFVPLAKLPTHMCILPWGLCLHGKAGQKTCPSLHPGGSC